MRQIRRILSLTSVLFAGYLIVVFIISVFGIYQTDTEVPLSNIQGILVKNHKIHLGIGPPTNRIQTYNLDGHFLKNQEINGGNQVYSFSVNEYDIPTVTKHYLTEQKTLSKALGNELIPNAKSHNYLNQITNPHKFIDEYGNMYEFQNEPLSNRLIINKFGESTQTIIYQGFDYKIYHIGYTHFIYFFVLMFFIVINASILGKHTSSKKFSIWRFLTDVFK